MQLKKEKLKKETSQHTFKTVGGFHLKCDLVSRIWCIKCVTELSADSGLIVQVHLVGLEVPADFRIHNSMLV